MPVLFVNTILRVPQKSISRPVEKLSGFKKELCAMKSLRTVWLRLLSLRTSPPLSPPHWEGFFCIRIGINTKALYRIHPVWITCQPLTRDNWHDWKRPTWNVASSLASLAPGIYPCSKYKTQVTLSEMLKHKSCICNTVFALKKRDTEKWRKLGVVISNKNSCIDVGLYLNV